MRFVVEPGSVRVMLGASSDDIRAEGEFVIEGSVRELSTADIVPTRAEADSV
jgi:beta-glucosidase